MIYVCVTKQGRNSNGLSSDRGRVTHALSELQFQGSFAKAWCGTAPSGRSGGWSKADSNFVTCNGCLNKIVKESKKCLL